MAVIDVARLGGGVEGKGLVTVDQVEFDDDTCHCSRRYFHRIILVCRNANQVADGVVFHIALERILRLHHAALECC